MSLGNGTFEQGWLLAFAPAILLSVGCSRDRALPATTSAPTISSAPAASSSGEKIANDEHAPPRLCARFDDIARVDGLAASTAAETAECIESMVETKKVSPDGCACLEKCTTVKSSLLVGLCTMTCVKNTPTLESLNVTWRRDALTRMTKAPRKPVEGTVTPFKGKPIGYRIDLPVGAEEQFRTQAGDEVSYKAGGLGGVSVGVLASDTMSARIEVSMAKATEHEVLARRETPAGCTLEARSQNGLFVTVAKTRPDGVFLGARCELLTSDAAALQKDLMPLLVAICESLQEQAPR